jgi:excisionase family DNA binding protein
VIRRTRGGGPSNKQRTYADDVTLGSQSILDGLVSLQDVTDDEFITVADVAGLLKVNQQTVRNWIDRGELPAFRVGRRRVRVRRNDLNAFIKRSSSTSRELPEPETERQATARSAFRTTMAAANTKTQEADQASMIDALMHLPARPLRLRPRSKHPASQPTSRATTPNLLSVALGRADLGDVACSVGRQANV